MSRPDHCSRQGCRLALASEQIVVMRPDGTDASNGSELCHGHLQVMVEQLPEKYPNGERTYRTIHLPPPGVHRA